MLIEGARSKRILGNIDVLYYPEHTTFILFFILVGK